MKDERRYMVLLITDEALLRIMNGDIQIKRMDLPSDVRVVDVFDDYTRRMMGLVLESKQFDPVPLGVDIPKLPPLELHREAF
jgi:hypothetical protein